MNVCVCVYTLQVCSFYCVGAKSEVTAPCHNIKCEYISLAYNFYRVHVRTHEFVYIQDEQAEIS